MSATARRGMIAGPGALLVLAAVGCSGHTASGHTAASGPAKTGTTASAQHATVQGSSPSPSAVPLDGAMLNALLLPASAMPAGFRLDASGSRNAGDSLPQDESAPVSGSKPCDLLTGTAWILAGQINTADFAQNDYLNASRTAEVAQEIDVFQPGDATKVMSRLWRTFRSCRGFSQQADGTTTSTSITRTMLPGVEDQAIKAVETAPVLQGGVTLVAIRVGDAIVTFLDSSPGSDLGAPAVTLAEHLAQRVRTAQQAS